MFVNCRSEVSRRQKIDKTQYEVSRRQKIDKIQCVRVYMEAITHALGVTDQASAFPEHLQEILGFLIFSRNLANKVSQGADS